MIPNLDSSKNQDMKSCQLGVETKNKDRNSSHQLLFAQNSNFLNIVIQIINGKSDITVLNDIDASLNGACEQQNDEFSLIFPYQEYFGFLLEIDDKSQLLIGLNFLSNVISFNSISFQQFLEENSEKFLNFLLAQLNSGEEPIIIVLMHIIAILSYQSSDYLKFFISNGVLSLIPQIPFNSDVLSIISYMYSRGFAPASVVLPFFEYGLESHNPNNIECSLAYLTKICLRESEDDCTNALSIVLNNISIILSYGLDQNELIYLFFTLVSIVDWDFTSYIDLIFNHAINLIDTLSKMSHKDIREYSDVIKSISQFFIKFKDKVTISSDICEFMYEISNILPFEASKSCISCYFACIDRNRDFSPEVLEKAKHYASDQSVTIHCCNFIYDLYIFNPNNQEILSKLEDLLIIVQEFVDDQNPKVAEFAELFYENVSNILDSHEK